MLGGALLGLGLGSLMSGDRHTNATDQNAANQTSGGNGEAAGATGTGDTQPSSAQQPQGNGLGRGLLIGIFALVVFFFVRRARARRRGY
jgi:hypothetical protein